MKITKDDVTHIANLSRLQLTTTEEEMFQKQLSKILVYVDALNEVKTDQIEPTSHVLNIENVMREDELRDSLSIDDALHNAPDRSGTFYKVPQIIE